MQRQALMLFCATALFGFIAAAGCKSTQGAGFVSHQRSVVASDTADIDEDLEFMSDEEFNASPWSKPGARLPFSRTVEDNNFASKHKR